MAPKPRTLVVGLAIFAVTWCGCRTTAEIRVENVSPFDFSDVSINGQPYEDVAVGETSEYGSVELTFRYTVLRLTAGGHKVNAQTLSFRGKRFTYRVDVLELDAGHLAVEILKD